MSGITVDIPDMGASEMAPSSEDSSTQNHHQMIGDPHHAAVGAEEVCLNYYSNSNGLYDQRFLASMVSPRINQRRSSAGALLETAHFLRTCGLCNRRLAHGKDIYMYRGDTAFCSVECREQQMKNDEIKEKCSSLAMASKKEDRHASTSSSSKAAASRKSETMAVA